MPSSEGSAYRKLPGRGGSALQRHRLWLAADHLLSVASSAVGERYRRFYFADIHALVWRPTAALGVRAAMWLLIAGASGAGGVVTGAPVRAVLFAVAGFCILALAGDLILGRTCACFVKTAVQFERLPSLRRERHIRKVLDRLRPLIEQAQSARPHADDRQPAG